MAFQRSRPVPRHHHVGLGQQRLEDRPVARLREVQPRRPLPEPGVRVRVVRLRQPRRVDPQYVRPQHSERPRRDGPGDDPGQVQDPHPGCGPALRGPPERSAPYPGFPYGLDQRLRLPVLMGDGDGQPALRVHELLHLDGRPPRHLGAQRLRCRGRQPKRPYQRGFVMGVVGVRADPAVRRPPEA